MRNEKRKFDRRERSSLTLERIRLLGSIGFQWGKRSKEELFERNFRMLQMFVDTQGNCNVPTKSRPVDVVALKVLSRWTVELRNKYKKGKLTRDQITRLEQIGFMWEAASRRSPRSHAAV